MEVWSSADPPVQTNNFPPEIDGIQMSLSLMTTPNPSDDILSKTLFTLWYIWKARNDNRFNRRTWTSTQIHQRAKAHMHTYLEALQKKKLQQLFTSQGMMLTYLLSPPIILVRPTLMQVPAKEKH